MYNPLKQLEKASTKLEGMYRGIVVDNNHPKKDGRIRVKVFGVFDDLSKDGIPWAEPAYPINTGGKFDQGASFVPELDSYVFVFFDRGDVNHPIYFATCPSIPAGIEPDLPKETRREMDETTYYPVKLEKRIVNIESSDQTKWSEPEPWFDGEYPWNHVLKFSNGIVIEFDNTPGRERIHIWHPSDSFVEIDKHGNMHIRNDNHRYEITVDNRKEYVGGDKIEDIDKSRFLRISGDDRKKVFEEKITWTLDKEHDTIDNDKREYIGANKDLTVSSNQRESISANKEITIGGNQNEKIGGNLEIDLGGAKLVKVGGNYHLEVGGDLSFKVGGNFVVDASQIRYQEGLSSSVSPTVPDSPKTPTKPNEETQEQ